MAVSFETIREWPVKEARAAIRTGAYTRHTAGLAPGRLQANLVVLPEVYAQDFKHFCALNPRPCPVVGMTEPSDPLFRSLGEDIDLRTDLPGYNIYRHGALDAVVTDLSKHWEEGLVGFALGCSFTFEAALIDAGIPLWHIANDTTVPMYRTSLPLAPAGPFQGTMVVSMRAIEESQVDRVRKICAQFPWAHGAPVHVGDPAEIGITTLDTPDWGDPAPIGPGQIPCFWACGVTPQDVVLRAKLPFVITHRPGHMLVTDIDQDVDTRPDLKLSKSTSQQGD